MIEPSLIIAGAAVLAVLVLTSFIITTFLKSVDAGEILLASRGRNLKIYRGPSKALIVPVITQVRVIPAQAINVDIEITDQTADVDANGRSAPVKVTVRASAIVSVGEDEAMVNTAANKFFSKSGGEQLSTLPDVLSSAGRRAINLLKHDQLFSVRSQLALGAPPINSTAWLRPRKASLGGHGLSRAIMHAILLVPMSSDAASAVRFCGIGRVFGVWLRSRPVMRHRLSSSTSCP